MLVLSRRANQDITFPGLGITLRVMAVRGQTVKMGVDAPREIAVMRGEIAPEQVEPEELLARLESGLISRSTRHFLRNELNRLSLQMHLFQRLTAAGRHDEADSTFASIVDGFEYLDRHLSGAPDGQTPERIAVSGSEQAVDVPVSSGEKRPRVLIVEDDVNERELLSGVLQMTGCEVHVAGDGVEALRWLEKNERPDLVLLDMRMPDCDGPETLHWIRQHESTADLKVYAVSGTPREECDLSDDEPLDGWFAKPLDPRRLIAELRSSATSFSA